MITVLLTIALTLIVSNAWGIMVFYLSPYPNGHDLMFRLGIVILVITVALWLGRVI